MFLIYCFYSLDRPHMRHFVKKSDPKEEALAKLKNKGPMPQQKVRVVWMESSNTNKKKDKVQTSVWLDRITLHSAYCYLVSAFHLFAFSHFLLYIYT